MVAVASAAVLAGSVLAVTSLDDDRRTAPVEQPKPVVGAVAVWYDAKGLHRGDVVEQTPVEIGVLGGNSDTLKGALALVRSGAVYLDPAAGDVWFHPWGGEPRIVGHDSAAGPGGDPNGDIAVWFEGSEPLNATAGELVVYDTAAGRVISRTLQSEGVADCSGICGDHYPVGNGFLQVSAERVVWKSRTQMYSHDVRTRTTWLVAPGRPDQGHPRPAREAPGAVEVEKDVKRSLADVHDDVEVLGQAEVLGQVGSVVVRAPGRAEQRHPGLETHVRLSPSGNYVLAVEATDERHAAAIVDTRTGELWRVPKNAYPWIAWSYGDMAMVDTEDELLACDAARRACERLPAERPFLMPTN